MQTWAWLRRRFAFFFLIGLVWSIASFVENLHMGRDAIQFVVHRLSEVTGWDNFFRACADILHRGLEWWRDQLRQLFEFFGISIPQWLHDPLSVFFFSVSRAAARAADSYRRELDAPDRFPDARVASYLRSGRAFRAVSLSVFTTMFLFLLPMAGAAVLDRFYATNEQISARDLIPYVVIFFLFAVVLLLAFRGSFLFDNEALAEAELFHRKKQLEQKD